MVLTMRWTKHLLRRLARFERQISSLEQRRAEDPALAKQPREARALCAQCRHALVRNPHQVRAGRARARNAPRDERGRFLPRSAVR